MQHYEDLKKKTSSKVEQKPSMQLIFNSNFTRGLLFYLWKESKFSIRGKDGLKMVPYVWFDTKVQ